MSDMNTVYIIGGYLRSNFSHHILTITRLFPVPEIQVAAKENKAYSHLSH